MTNEFNTASAPFNIAAIGNPADYQMQDMKGAGFVGGLAGLGFQIAEPAAAQPSAPVAAQTLKK
jgi:uncharacterized protein YlxW (UPF0749 family)